MGFPAQAKNMITNLIARDVAAGVELARSLGYAMPRDFDVGVRFLDNPTRVRMRLNDAELDSIVHLPDENSGLHGRAHLWRRAWERMQSDALTLSHVWISKHPEAAVKDAEVTLSLLDRMKVDREASDRWMAGCRERAAAFTYSRR